MRASIDASRTRRSSRASRPRRRQPVDAAIAVFLGQHQAFCLERAQGGIDTPRRGAVGATEALLQLGHQLVAVARGFGHQRQDDQVQLARPEEVPASPPNVRLVHVIRHTNCYERYIETLRMSSLRVIGKGHQIGRSPRDAECSTSRPEAAGLGW